MVTQNRLMQLYRYDGQTGEFNRLVGRGGMAAGTTAGYINGDGYSVMGVDGIEYRRSRLAWLYVHGRHPIGEIDHINGDRSDDRIANLREATREQNMWNTRVSRKSTTGIKGVYWIGKCQRYEAHLSFKGREIYVGRFRSADEAISAVVAMREKLHGEFARH